MQQERVRKQDQYDDLCHAFNLLKSKDELHTKIQQRNKELETEHGKIMNENLILTQNEQRLENTINTLQNRYLKSAQSEELDEKQNMLQIRNGEIRLLEENNTKLSRKVEGEQTGKFGGGMFNFKGKQKQYEDQIQQLIKKNEERQEEVFQLEEVIKQMKRKVTSMNEEQE
eukprot:UN33256